MAISYMLEFKVFTNQILITIGNYIYLQFFFVLILNYYSICQIVSGQAQCLTIQKAGGKNQS